MRAVGSVATLLGVGLVVTLAGCSSDNPEAAGESGAAEGGGSLTVWIQEDLPDRVAASQAIVDEFTAATGTEVELVPVAEDQFSQVLTSSAAAGDLPDVIGGISLPQVRTLSANELVDTEATASVVETLGRDTFSERALELTSDGDTQLAVPSESWAQLLYYRTDLFEAAGLAAPDSYEDIMAAAEALDSPEIAGFVGANSPGDAFTEQTFEHIALGNGCELVDEAGEVLLDSPECVAAFQFYGDLIADYSVPGAQDVDTTRASYFAGEAAMFIWSTFVLDELAGLREDALPTCPECADDPGFLAANTGVVGAIAGPDGSEPAQFGEISSWAVTEGADVENATAFIEYMLSDGYLQWLEIAPEGKVPVRLGTAENPTEFSEAWTTLEVGVDTKAPLSDFYTEDVLERLAAGPEEIARWAIPQGQGDLLGAMQGESPVAGAVSEVTSGGADAQAVAEQTAETVRSIQDSLQ